MGEARQGDDSTRFGAVVRCTALDSRASDPALAQVLEAYSAGYLRTSPPLTVGRQGSAVSLFPADGPDGRLELDTYPHTVVTVRDVECDWSDELFRKMGSV